ncbi:MAG: 50S ribosomal protein L11 methyltransferase [Clostridia bacterium]|nr:50S ribosomal protein L11 methyltransferase [Clostridia bacterium]
MGEWTKLSVRGRTEELEAIAAVMSMLDNGLMIEDYSDVSLDGVYGDLIDESILNADRAHGAVSLFVPAEKSLSEYVSFLRERFGALGMDVKIETEGLREEDWAEAWKQYYKPIPLGRVTVVPAWQDYTPAKGEAIIRMDPGMAFGTGTHETTRLVMRFLQDVIKGGERVLDLGCGSGILSLCASKLGASFCAAYDIDPVAVRVAEENIRADGAENIVCGVSDLLRSVDASGGKYDFVVANIVADVIIRLLPDVGAYMTENGRMIVSGIIGPRAEEVRVAIAANDFRVVEERQENDWLAILIEKQ